MAARAEGPFQLTSWDEHTYEELDGGGMLTRARIGQDFSGDLEATSRSEVLLCYRADGTACFTGLQRVSGRISGPPRQRSPPCFTSRATRPSTRFARRSASRHRAPCDCRTASRMRGT